ncbi:MAG: alpha/beta hydrolase [Acidimicrobiales bacterium]
MSETTHIRGVDLAWERSGAGTTLVWAHGLNSCRADEDRLGLIDWAEVAKSGQVFRYDARGHGESGFTTEAEAYSWDQMALDQLELTASAGVDSYIAGGASLGAATTLHAAVADPARIEKLLLVIPPTGWETRDAQTETYEQMAQILERKGVGPLLIGAQELPVPDPLIGLDEWAEHRLSGLRDADPVRMAGLFRGAATANLPNRDLVRLIDSETLILAWSGDPVHPVSSAEELGDLLPNCTVKIATTWAQLQSWTQEAVAFIRA